MGCAVHLVERSAHTALMCAAQGMLLYTLASIGSASALFLSYSLLVVVRTRPWWQPQVPGVPQGFFRAFVFRGLHSLLLYIQPARRHPHAALVAAAGAQGFAGFS